MRKICTYLVVLASLVAISGTLWAAKPKPKPKFPQSTTLAGVTTTEKLSAVIKRLGPNYKKDQSKGENPTLVIIYNDPEHQAHLIINSGAGTDKLTSDLTVCSISLVKGRIKGKYFAGKPFTPLGDYYGLTLGATKDDLRKARGTSRYYKIGQELWTSFAVDSPQDWPCEIQFRFEKEKIVQISSGFWP